MMKPHCNQGTLIHKKKRLKDLDTTGTFVHSFSSVSINFEEERDGDSFLLLHSFHLPQKLSGPFCFSLKTNSKFV